MSYEQEKYYREDNAERATRRLRSGVDVRRLSVPSGDRQQIVGMLLGGGNQGTSSGSGAGAGIAVIVLLVWLASRYSVEGVIFAAFFITGIVLLTRRAFNTPTGRGLFRVIWLAARNGSLAILVMALLRFALNWYQGLN